MSGDLGSGKTTAARELSHHLDWPLVGSGDVQRQIAKSMGLSTLQTNWLAEQKAAIDAQIDGALIELNEEDRPLIVDARLAWHFVKDSFKVHFVVAPSVGAERLMRGRFSAVERYRSVEDARTAAEARYASERSRFQLKYGVDISRLRNYDLIVDTSDADPHTISAAILRAMAKPQRIRPEVLVSPKRVIPTRDSIRELSDRNINGPVEPGAGPSVPSLGYSRPYFFLMRGARALSKDVDSSRSLAEAYLEVEGSEYVVGGMTADEYFRSEVQSSWIYDWEDAHGFRFSDYPSFDEA